MKKGMIWLGLLLVAAALALPTIAQAGAMYAEVTLAPVGRHFGSPPPLGRKQGWLTITNRDWSAYTMVANRKDKLFLYRQGEGPGGILIPSGATITIALEKETYELYGNNSDKLKVKVREGRTTTLTLEPFGYVGQTGLRGVSNDGDRVRSEILFPAYTAVVVERPQPPVIINRPPPPPPVVINRPPVVVHRRPPPPPPPPRRHDRRDGWGFMFGYQR